MRFAVILLAAASFLAWVPPDARAENWPNWRGPHLNGSSPEKGLPARWGKGGGEGTRDQRSGDAGSVKWVARLPGPGAATPVIWGERIFLSSIDKASKKLLGMCLDARDGSVLWRVELGDDRHAPSNTMAAPSPVTDGKRVWFLFGTGDLACLDLRGKVLWSRNLVDDYGSFAIKFGYSSSPLLWRNKLFVPVLQREQPYPYNPVAEPPPKRPFESFILALDAATGKAVWRHVRDTDAWDESREVYITPMPCELAGRAELLINGGEYVTGHDPDSGRELWRWEFAPGERHKWQRLISTLVTGHGRIYSVRARGDELFALKPGARGRAGRDIVAWKSEGPYPDACTPLLYGGSLYVLGGDQKTLTCLDPATGRVRGRRKFETRHVFRASPTGADGKIYCVNEEGELWVLRASPSLDILFHTSLGEKPCRSTIAVSGGKLFIRTPTKLYCIGK